MTRRDFVALAEALRAARPMQTKDRHGYVNATDEIRMDVWKECVRAVASACQGQNPRFDRERFYSACGYEG